MRKPRILTLAVTSIAVLLFAGCSIRSWRTVAPRPIACGGGRTQAGMVTEESAKVGDESAFEAGTFSITSDAPEDELRTACFEKAADGVEFRTLSAERNQILDKFIKETADLEILCRRGVRSGLPPEPEKIEFQTGLEEGGTTKLNVMPEGDAQSKWRFVRAYRTTRLLMNTQYELEKSGRNSGDRELTELESSGIMIAAHRFALGRADLVEKKP